MLSDLTVPGLRAAHRMVELLSRLGTPRESLGVLVTRGAAGPLTLKDLERTLGTEPLVVLPDDPAAATAAMNAGAPLNGKPCAPATAIGELASTVAGVRPVPGATAPRLLQRIFRREAWA